MQRPRARSAPSPLPLWFDVWVVGMVLLVAAFVLYGTVGPGRGPPEPPPRLEGMHRATGPVHDTREADGGKFFLFRVGDDPYTFVVGGCAGAAARVCDELRQGGTATVWTAPDRVPNPHGVWVLRLEKDGRDLVAYDPATFAQGAAASATSGGVSVLLLLSLFSFLMFGAVRHAGHHPPAG
jgi:hypothetical protein